MAVDDAYTKLLLHMDGADNGTTFTDEAGNTATASGNVCTKTATKKFGTASAYFDGTDDYLTVPLSDDLKFGTADWTIDFWVYPVARAPGGYPCLFANLRTWGPGAMALFADRADASGKYLLYVDNVLLFFTSTTNVAYGQWSHIELDKTSGVLRFSVNGVLDNSRAWTTPVNGTGANPVFTLGGYPESDNLTRYKGYIEEFRISKGIARHTANFTPPTTPYGPAGYKTAGTAVFGPYVLPEMIADPTSSSIEWTEDLPTGTSLTIKAAIVDTAPIEGDYQTVTNGGGIPGLSQASSGKNLYLKAYLSTSDTAVTPKLLTLGYGIVEAPDTTKIHLTLTDVDRMKCPAGDVTVSYAKAAGNLAGELGGQVDNFVLLFAPTNIDVVFNPNDVEHISADLSIASNIMKIYYEDYKLDEYISAALSIVSTIIAVSDIPT